MEGVKKHSIFNVDVKFWETCVLFKNTLIRGDEKNKGTSVFASGIVRNILSVAFHMNDVFNDKMMIRELANRFLLSYKIPDNQASDLIAYINSLMKKEKQK